MAADCKSVKSLVRIQDCGPKTTLIIQKSQLNFNQKIKTNLKLVTKKLLVKLVLKIQFKNNQNLISYFI